MGTGVDKGGADVEYIYPSGGGAFVSKAPVAFGREGPKVALSGTFS